MSAIVFHAHTQTGLLLRKSRGGGGGGGGGVGWVGGGGGLRVGAGDKHVV